MVDTEFESVVTILKGDSFLTIRLIEGPHDPYYRDDLYLVFDGSHHDYSCKGINVWVRKKTFQDFLTELKRLDEFRMGSATLRCIDNDNKLFVEFYSTDTLGHVCVKGFLTSEKTFHSEPYSSRVWVDFELDPTPDLDLIYRTLSKWTH